MKKSILEFRNKLHRVISTYEGVPWGWKIFVHLPKVDIEYANFGCSAVVLPQIRRIRPKMSLSSGTPS